MTRSTVSPGRVADQFLDKDPCFRTLYRMVNYSYAALDRVFSALSDPTRRSILARLLEGEASVSELAAPQRMTLPAVMKHLQILDSAGLVARRKEGRVSRCRLRAKPMRHASEWLGQYRRFWESQLDALESFLKQEEP